MRHLATCDGGATGSGGTGTILANGRKVDEGRIPRTQPAMFSADKGADMRVDEGTPVTDDSRERDNRFTGTIGKGTIELLP